MAKETAEKGDVLQGTLDMRLERQVLAIATVDGGA